MPSVMPLASDKRVSRVALLASLILAIVPSAARAQGSNTFQACTQGALQDCALIQLTSGTMYGANFFEIAIQNQGSTSGLATDIYNLVFETGQDPTSGTDTVEPPKPIGGATLTSPPAAWDIFDGGDAIFLSAIDDNLGVGGCVAGANVVTDGSVFGQGGQTCGGNAFLVFKFFTAALYDPSAFTLTDLEVAGLTSDPTLQADSCGDPSLPCRITAATPEPSSILLAITGFSALAGLRLRRRRTVA